MSYIVAGIDVHKKVLMVSVADAEQMDPEFECRRFGTTASELNHLTAWLQEHGVAEVVMESTAQYWKPVWLALEPHFKLNLAQAQSNRAPKGRKTDFKDAQRLVRRLNCWRTDFELRARGRAAHDAHADSPQSATGP